MPCWWLAQPPSVRPWRASSPRWRPWTLASNGFRDTSRLAASDVTMMSDILMTNQRAILDALALFRAQLDALEAAIRSSDEAALRGILGRARQVRIDWFKMWSAPSE